MLLGVCARTFRHYVDRYEEAGLETHPSTGHPQSVLQQPGCVADRGRDLLRSMAKTEPRPPKIMFIH